MAARWHTGFYRSLKGETYRLGYQIVAESNLYDSLSQPLQIECPITILHGDRDEVVPVANTLKFMDQIKAPALTLEVVEGGDHRLLSAMPRICAELDKLWIYVVKSDPFLNSADGFSRRPIR